jgi:phosphoribosylformylglycinamidine synthase subunit PurSL
VLGIHGIERASSGQRFAVCGERLSAQDLHRLAQRLLANPTIQRYALGEIEPAFPHPAQASSSVEVIPIRELSDEGLLSLSQAHLAALDLHEMRTIQEYFQQQERDLTDVEFETLAQTWSEHCVHKTFKARITAGDERIDGLLRTFIRAATERIAAPWVLSAFQDNAGIIVFDDEYEVSFKVETHNHPSAIEPFGGANTGIGGVIRDVLGVSAKPIAATDVLCFGPLDAPLEELPASVLHPRRIQSGVVAGIEDYGNKIGIPTVNGAVLYDEGYTANPLVFCGCVGIAPRGSHPRSPQPGDRVIVLGGGTGRDGLRGATFSSMTMDAHTGEVSGASVQIGDPITEKGLIEVVTRARDRKLYHAVTDCGAGGLSSAVGEMASNTGADVDLTNVRLKYPGLAPWEIWLSEAQERMVLAVPTTSMSALQELCDIYDVHLSDIGTFNFGGRLVVRYAGQVVLDLDNHFLHAGIPQPHLQAKVPIAQRIPSTPHAVTGKPEDFAADLLALLSHPDIASKEHVVRVYDHEVQGGTAVKPLTGLEDDGPSDACVLKPIGTQGRRGIVLANGINPNYGKLDPFRMAVSVVDEAIRNAVAVGADPQRIALLDNFCWGDPRRPETLGALVEAARGCHDAALHYSTPFISGKDSLNNEYKGPDGERHAIPPTLLISAIGIIDDVTQAVTMDLKVVGNLLYLLGEHDPSLAGGHYALLHATRLTVGEIPTLPSQAPQLYRNLYRSIQAGLVCACHDLSEGGLLVAAAEMCIGGRLGLALDLEGEPDARALFGQVNGCLLVEVSSQNRSAFETSFASLPCRLIGQVSQQPRLSVTGAGGEEVLSLPISELVSAWKRVP